MLLPLRNNLEGDANASGAIGTVICTAPQATATGGATCSGAIGTIVCSAPTATATGGATCSGAIGTVTCTAPTATATGQVIQPPTTGGGWLPVRRHAQASGELPTVYLLPPEACARGVVQRDPARIARVEAALRARPGTRRRAA